MTSFILQASGGNPLPTVYSVLPAVFWDFRASFYVMLALNSGKRAMTAAPGGALFVALARQSGGDYDPFGLAGLVP